MNSKTINMIWSVTLIIISVLTIIISVSSIIGADLPDILKRMFGIIDLIAIPFLVFSTIAKVKNKEGK